MAEQDKRKTKTVILRELESIKGLLDDDDIPLLQEVIDNAEEDADSQEILDGDDLAELQQAYRDLLQARGMEPELAFEDGEPPILHEIETEPTDDLTPKDNQAEAPAAPASATAVPATSAKEPWDEFQTSLFDTDNGLSAPSSDATRRSSVTKASGENPFLPAHIRERLHGNRPPPLFEPVAPVNKNQPTPKTTEPTSANINRMQLVEEVVNSLLPQVRAKLHDALLELDAEQLSQLLNDEPADHDTE